MTAEDRASDSVQSAVTRINSRYRDFRNTQRAVGRGFELEHQGFSNTIRSLTTVGRVAHTATSIFQRYNVMQLRMEQGARSLKRAQSDLSEAISKYGANSAQAAKASANLTEEQAKNAALQRENILNNAGLGLSGLTTLGTLNRNGALGRGIQKLGGAKQAGIKAGAAVGGLLGGAEIGHLLLNAVYGEEEGNAKFAGFTGIGGQKNTTVNVNTNEIGVTSDDVINSSDVFG
jgi:hypothetical protein